jgi:hypothetical protein
MQELKTILEQLNIPVAYNHFNTETEPPCVTFRRDSTSNFGADNKVYKKINNYVVQLYTDLKNPTLETQLENLFDANNIFYDVTSEDYIDTENMYEVIYEVTIENEVATN